MSLCHLCGLEIEQDGTREHVPPKQFFPSELRAHLNPNLYTVPTHNDCNKAYQRDEDYFISSLGSVTESARVHESLMKDIERKLRRDESQGLLRRVLGEFWQPARIVVPGGKVAKYTDMTRVRSVSVKIVKGLHYLKYSDVLADSAIRGFDFFSGSEMPSEWYMKHIGNGDVEGEYPAIFGFRHNKLTFVDSEDVGELWALFFWDSFVAVVAVLDREESGE